MKIKPALYYMGSKWRLASWIISHFPPHTSYIETHAGSAAILLKKRPCSLEIYNDKNDDAVNLFRILRDRTQAIELQRLLELTPYSRTEYLQAYERSTEPIEQARRLIVRSAMGFVGASSNKYRAKFRSISLERNIKAKSYVSNFRRLVSGIPILNERLLNIQIENTDALKLIPKFDSPETLYYVDPPYPQKSRASGTRYIHEMTDKDHRLLAGVLRQVKGYVIISGYPSFLYDGLYGSWQSIEKPDNKNHETLWMNDRTSAWLASRSLKS